MAVTSLTQATFMDALRAALIGMIATVIATILSGNRWASEVLLLSMCVLLGFYLVESILLRAKAASKTKT